MTLFKCTAISSIRDLPDRVEYLRAKNDKVIKNMYNQCFGISGSTYFGYNSYKIRKMKISDFPEIMTIEINYGKT